MKLIPLPASEDNYLWLLHDGRRALVVDSGDARPVAACLQQEGLRQEPILFKHRHRDHIGGVEALRNATDDLFEGSRAQVLSSLDKLSALPADTQVCCTAARPHETAAFATLRQWKNEFKQ
jgi:hydroxyacylglutathione hydrolase